MNPWLLAGTTFLASSVEFVEAATIVLAVAVTQGWKPALLGTLGACISLALLVGLGAPILTNAVSLARLELIVGPFLILFGIAWLRKAVWRYAGRKAMHDEEAIYTREVASLKESTSNGVAVAFQGVFVEGLEVAVVVVTFAASATSLLAWSVGGALLALIVVAIATVALRTPFSRVPENLLKAIVGVMLLSLGTYWTGEGAGITWWIGDATLFALIICYTLTAAVLVGVHRARA